MAKNLKLARNIALTVVSLLIVVVGGGLAYTWYMGEHAGENSKAFADETTASVQPKISVPKVNQTAVVGASVQMLTSPVTPGSNASIMVGTNPQASCVIVVEYDKVRSKDSGLTEKKADEYGIVEWAWTVEPTAPLGTWPVTVTCANQKNSAMVRGDLKVVKSIEE